ncbi:lysozyme inhibitor LprI family protein [Bauldia sp.]|uniref:lysozyme inhibitor LprI family protein n=1 Tax=Bauldia sp. TaxID=2575872 RepID=UPI003BAC8D3F
MSIRSTIVAAAVIGPWLVPGAAHAASFDCAKAATPTEHAICDNPQLSSLDEQTAGLYFTLISGGAPDATASVADVKAEQAKFLTKRNACGANYNCLIGAYTDQIMYLNAASGKGM